MKISFPAKYLILGLVVFGLSAPGLLFGWEVVFGLLAVMAWAWGGYLLAGLHLDNDREALWAERAALVDEWRALEHTGYIRCVMFDARRAMQAEALRAGDDWAPRFPRGDDSDG